MNSTIIARCGLVALGTSLIVTHVLLAERVSAQGQKATKATYPYATYKAGGVPMFQVDPTWPKMPENNWLMGEVPNVAVDAQDHVWVLQRPGTLKGEELYAAEKPAKADCCIPAPPVLEFDAAGHFIQGWGGPGPGYEWPEHEHGLHVDYKGNVWLSGGGEGTKDHQILKFTKAGKFLLQIGHSGQGKGASGVPAIIGSHQAKNLPTDGDTENVNQATGLYVYPKTNELFVSDGYVNRRVIVFDADTGTFKRMWGAYGNKPDDSAPRDKVVEGPGPKAFNTVHDVRVSNDELVYVLDRSNCRVQVFHLDGKYVAEVFIERNRNSVTDGVAFSPDAAQKFMYITDSPNEHVWILNRKTLQILGRFGRRGHYPGEWFHLHGIAADSKGNLYTAEGITGHRVQKFTFKGFSSSASQ